MFCKDCVKGKSMHFQGRQLLKLLLLPSERESTLKEKNLLPLGANSFLLELTPLKKGFDV